MGIPVEPAQVEGGIIIVSGGTDNPNPVIAPWNNFYVPIFESLVETNPLTIEPVGNLAEAWEVSEDGLGWTFTLREGVTWHDGEAFGADDVKYTYDALMNPEGPSEVVSTLEPVIESVEVVDELTVAFNLIEPVTDFIASYVSDYWGIGAEHVLGTVPIGDLSADAASTGDDPARVVGTGPFKLVEYVVDERIEAARYDGYWDGAPYLDTYIVTLAGDDESAQNALLLTGDIDLTVDHEKSFIPDLEATGEFQIGRAPVGCVRFLAFNQDPEKTTLFLEKAVRQALYYAIDRQAIIDAVEQGWADNPVSTMAPGSPFLDVDQLPQYGYDPELAAQMLDEAGWVLGDNDIRAKDGQQLSFTFWTRDSGGRPEMAAAIQESWRQIGVEIEIMLEPFNSEVERAYGSHDFEVQLIHLCWSPAVPDQSVWLASDQYEGGNNAAMYSNPQVDELLAQGLVETDPEARKEIYTQIQQIVMDDLVYAPMAVALDSPIATKRLHNVYLNWLPFTFNTEVWWME
jgi:peptide/nickel transport system substrate-binding protein